MSVEAWALVVALVGLPASIITVVLVARGEVARRRRWPLVMWSFSHYGTRSFDDDRPDQQVAELVQFGGSPTRVFWYYTVGFRVHQEADARLRSYIRGEDVLPLFITLEAADSAWLLVAHTPRDNKQWMQITWVPLDPAGSKLQETFNARYGELRREQRSWRGRAHRAWRVVAMRPMAEPVGPAGVRSARLSMNRASTDVDKLTADLEVVMSLAKAEDPGGGPLPVH
jgi:hypothetical protein